MTALPHALKAVRRDERGTGAIELALLAPMLALVTVGMVDLTEGVSRRTELHDAVHRTLEKVAARRFKLTVTEAGVDTAFMKADAAEGAGGEAAGVTPADVTVNAWLECDGVHQGDNSFSSECPPLEEPDEGCDEEVPPEGAKCIAILARYVQVRIDTTYSPSFGKIVLGDENGEVPLFAEAAVRVQ